MPISYSIRIQLPTRDAITAFTAKWQLDYGCHIHVVKNEKGFSLSASANEKTMAELQKTNIAFEIIEQTTWNEEDIRKLIGEGDRYQGGKITPKRLI